MPALIADGRIRLRALTTAPDDPTKITVTEFNAGTELECAILKSDYRLGPTGSDTVSDTPLCASGNATVYGSSNIEGTITVIRMLDPDTGQPDAQAGDAWDLAKEKGSILYLVETEGPEYTADGAVDDEYSYYEMITDNPQPPQDRGGYIKRTVPLGSTGKFALNKELVSAT